MLDIFKTEKVEFYTAATVESLDSLFKQKRYLSEVAFIGRSNVGKSTLLNRLTCKNKLAFVSKTPGKTQTVNFFNFDNKFIIVDLPGYGYATVSKTQQATWSELITHYILNSRNLSMLFLLIDARRGIGKKDLEALKWTDYNGIKTSIIITKVDHILKSDREKILEGVNVATANFKLLDKEAIMVSSKENLGETTIRKRILQATMSNK